ncbi:Crp/Fnr family transcriptional regulator [Persicobacter diffluens]|uniref:Crp/Fnr family transcriptional regulator n=1 Tax=Persicobacter diffluens TaxID=981 RepID=A0AAN4W268_9BACT|nr:Crp/Fnr family transcriptional regulator [Persicobacter diffluens]
MSEDLIIKNFSAVFEKPLLEEVLQIGAVKSVKAGELMMDIGDHIRSMPIIIDGTVKIVREDEEGNEVFLYYVNPKETCAMSLTCCLGNATSSIRATVEEDCKILFLPVQKMDEWMKKYASWRQFVIGSYQNRFEELLGAVDLLAFKKMDERLMTYLQERVKIKKSMELQITHGDIARDLGTSREVISRLLKALEKSGKIKLGRNRLVLIGQSLLV